MTAPTLSPRSLLARELAGSEAELDLARACLLVAKEEYPQLCVELYQARLDQIAEEVKDRLANETAPVVVLDELISTLFRRRRFKGNRDAYYDPRNSFLNDVLDRSVGIPLTLGIVVLEVSWRLGLPVEGVSFPGHFLVRYRGEDVNLLIDPFDEGRIRFEDQAQELLDRVYGGLVRVQAEFMRRAGKRDMLARLLTNLKGVYLKVNDHRRALAAVERLLLVTPGAPGELRTRGLLLARLGRPVESAHQLEEYLRASPHAADAARLMRLIRDQRAGTDISDTLESM